MEASLQDYPLVFVSIVQRMMLQGLLSLKNENSDCWFEQSSRNAADGISNTDSGRCLDKVESMLQRMRELAVQSANGTYTIEDRIAIQRDYPVKWKIIRISENTEFNT